MSAACGSPPAASPSGGGAPKSRRHRKPRAAAAAQAAAAASAASAVAAPVVEPEPEVPPVFQKQPGDNDRRPMPTVSPEQMSALQQALPGYTQQGGVLVPAYSAFEFGAAVHPSPPDVLLLVHDPNQPHQGNHSQSSAWQPIASIIISGAWFPLRISTADSSKVTFIQQPAALRLRKQSQENLDSMRQVNDRIKKRTQLTAALRSNKEAHVLAKQEGELSDVGALAIERDRIEEELATMEAEDKEAEAQYAQQQLQEQQQMRMQGYGYHQQQPKPERGGPVWSEQVTVQQTIDLPFGYCGIGVGNSRRVYNIVKVQQIDIAALPKKQTVIITPL